MSVPSEVEELRSYLDRLPPGKIEGSRQLEKLLSAAWDHFGAVPDTSMTANKLHGRMEDPEWHAPVLSFNIERHGMTKLGSTKASVQRWEVDIDGLTAYSSILKHRLVRPRNEALDVQPLAEDLAEAILTHSDDPKLSWMSEGVVRVRIGKIIPDDHTPKQTVQGRRKRFRNALTEILTQQGWEELGPNKYRKIDGY